MERKYNKEMIIEKAVSHVCADVLNEINKFIFTDRVKEYLDSTVKTTVIDVGTIDISDVTRAKEKLVEKLRSLVIPTQ